MASETLLTARGIRKSYGATQALAGVDLELRAGEVHFIAGENGAGKSTLMKVLSGIIADHEGEFHLHGKVAMIHQELSLLDNLSIADNLFLGREKRSLGFVRRREQEKEAATWCARLGLNVPMRRLVGSLSLPQKALLEIAKALSQAADIYIMDEPTSALPEEEAQRLFKVIGELKAQGKAIAYISHKMNELQLLADRITVLRDGRWVSCTDISNFQQEKFLQDLVGRPLGEQFPARLKLPSREIVLSVRDFELHKGEILGIAGLEGAGHTELLHGLFDPPAKAMREGRALLTNDRKGNGLVLEHSIRDNLVLADLKALSPWWLPNNKRMRECAEDMKGRLRIKCSSVAQRVGALSGGNQQKVVLGKWLQTRPKVLLLDDPTRGVDIGAKQEIYSILRELTAEGVAVLVYSSELPELIGLCDRIMVLRQGRVQGVHYVDISNRNHLQSIIIKEAMGVTDVPSVDQAERPCAQGRGGLVLGAPLGVHP